MVNYNLHYTLWHKVCKVNFLNRCRVSGGKMNHTSGDLRDESSSASIFKLISILFEPVLPSVNRGWRRDLTMIIFASQRRKVSGCESAPKTHTVIFHLPHCSSSTDRVFIRTKCSSSSLTAGQ